MKAAIPCRITGVSLAALLLLSGCGGAADSSPETDPSPVAWPSTSADPGASGTASTALTATEIIDIFPFGEAGELAPEWRVDMSRDGDAVLQCDGPSDHARADGTLRCGARSDGAEACWPVEGDVIQCLDPWDPQSRVLHQRRGTNDSGVALSTAAPDHPVPLFLELADGSQWTYARGAGETRSADGRSALYVCTHETGKCSSENVVLAIDTNNGVWTVEVGAVGTRADSDPSTDVIEIAIAWFVGGPSGPDQGVGDQGPLQFTGQLPGGEQFDLSSVEKWLGDMVAGDVPSLERNCWTFAPESVRAMYVESDREAIKDQLMAGPPQGAQYGLSWPEGPDGLSIGVFWKELDSSYACPVIQGPSVADTGARQATYIVERLIARASGDPVNSADTPENYFLGCEELDLASWDETEIYPRLHEARVLRTVKNGPHWTVDTDAATFDISAESFGGCIDEFRMK